MKKLLLLICFLTLSLANAQKLRSEKRENKIFETEIEKSRKKSPNGVVRCATHENLIIKQKNKQALSDNQFEDWISSKVSEIKKLRSAKKLPSIIKIPVVVHVIHDGDAIGTNENISDAQVLSQITVLNQDFRKLSGTPGAGAGVDTSIEFCLAQVDPNGNPTNGIHRVNLGVAGFDQAAVEGNLKPNTIWDPTKYFNMWTANFTGDLAKVLGYAQFPTGSGLTGMPSEDCISGEASTDGLIMAYGTFGSRAIYPGGNYNGADFDKGRTATHEIGHMFGLRHTWGDGGCEVDDFCNDTPNCADDYYAGTEGTSCQGPVQCGNVRQVENYMDYSADACMNMFTQDQKDRMMAVIMNSPRRDDLLVSPVCNAPTASIQFKRGACETRMINADVIEGNGCGFTDYTIPLNINKAPTQNAVVTFAIDANSVANTSDFSIMTPSITFNSGSIADKNLIVRVLNDGTVEPDEDLVINFTVNSNGGDAFANPEGNKLKMTIVNDDKASKPTVTGGLSENFDPLVNDFSLFDEDGDGKTWSVNSEANFNTTVGFSGNFALSLSFDKSGALTPDNYLVSKAISIPAGANASLSFTVGTIEPSPYHAEHYAVYVGTASTPNNIKVQTPVFEETLATGNSFRTVSVNLNSYAGQTVYLAFRHFNTQDMNTLIVDDINLSYQSTTLVQTNVNVATQYQSNISGTGTTYSKDSATDKVIVDITNNVDFNYGCTTVAVSRDQSTAGAAAVNYGANTASNLRVMAKAFKITPATNNVSGSATLKFYLTEAELAAWETATGNSRSSLKVVKEGNSSALPVSLAKFGTNTTVTTNVANGIGGVYYFGTDASLSNSDFQFENFALYPNPNKGSFKLNLNSDAKKIDVKVFDLEGRMIFDKGFANSGMFDQEVKLNNLQSGVYLVSISDGVRKTVKRIVVEK